MHNASPWLRRVIFVVILCVRGPYYECNGRGYAVLPGADIRAMTVAFYLPSIKSSQGRRYFHQAAGRPELFTVKVPSIAARTPRAAPACATPSSAPRATWLWVAPAPDDPVVRPHTAAAAAETHVAPPWRHQPNIAFTYIKS